MLPIDGQPLRLLIKRIDRQPGKLGRSFLFALNEQTNNADDDHAELIQLCEAYVHSTTPSCERESPLLGIERSDRLPLWQHPFT